MSERAAKEQFNNTQMWTNRLLPIAMSVVLAVSSWFLNLAWNKISELEYKVHNIELSNATSRGVEFTRSDWVEAKRIMDQDRNNMETRIIRLEEAVIVIKDTLIELKKDHK
jgi:hypothetical protein